MIDWRIAAQHNRSNYFCAVQHKGNNLACREVWTIIGKTCAKSSSCFVTGAQALRSSIATDKAEDGAMRVLGVEWSRASVMVGCALALTAHSASGQPPISTVSLSSGVVQRQAPEIDHTLPTGPIPLVDGAHDHWTARKKVTRCLQDQAMSLAATTRQPIAEIVAATMGTCLDHDAAMSDDRQASLGRIIGMLATMERGRHMALASAK
ncbi:MAG: hypothetical protein K2P80_02750 [Beijerinckiaceae bacterium]|nr:hypothetical protein [Beijerinckiaceae bacterium]